MNNLEDISKYYWNNCVDMAKKHNIDPWRLVKIRDRLTCSVAISDHPDFNLLLKNGCKVEFYVTIIDNHPVFKDDIVYNSEGVKFVVINKYHYNFGTVIKCFLCGDVSKKFDFFIDKLYINNPKENSSDQFTKDELDYIRYKINQWSKDDRLSLECIIKDKISKQMNKL